MKTILILLTCLTASSFAKAAFAKAALPPEVLTYLSDQYQFTPEILVSSSSSRTIDVYSSREAMHIENRIDTNQCILHSYASSGLGSSRHSRVVDPKYCQHIEPKKKTTLDRSKPIEIATEQGAYWVVVGRFNVEGQSVCGAQVTNATRGAFYASGTQSLWSMESKKCGSQKSIQAHTPVQPNRDGDR